MATITVRVSDQEKDFLDKMAKFMGKTLSELLKTTTLTQLEDEYDAKVGEVSYGKYLQNPKSRPLKDIMDEYDL